MIRKVLEDAFNEVSWRQPSVILLDDLDQVTRAPLGPEEEMGPEAAFNAHVAQGKAKEDQALSFIDACCATNCTSQDIQVCCRCAS